MGIRRMNDEQRINAARGAYYRFLGLEGDDGRQVRHAADLAFCEAVGALEYLKLRLKPSEVDHLMKRLDEGRLGDRQVDVRDHSPPNEKAA